MSKIVWIRAVAVAVMSIVTVCLLPAARARQSDFGAQKAKLASVRLECRDINTGQKIWSGTGFFATGHSLAITNNHVASEAALHPERAKLVAIFTDGSEVEAVVVLADALLDLAALSIPQKPQARLDLRFEAPVLGEPMAGAGYGLGLDFSLSEGRVAALSRSKTANPRIQLSAATDGGVSGGPTLDARGRAIGVNVAGAGRGVALAIPAASADAFLSRAEQVLTAGDSWSKKSSAQVRALYVEQVGAAGLMALSSVMEHSAVPARLGLWSLWAPSSGGDWSCRDVSAGEKKSPEPWQSRVQGFFCAMGSTSMSVGRTDAGISWSYAASRLDIRSEGSWSAWVSWIGLLLKDRLDEVFGSLLNCQTRAFRYGTGLGRAQVCAEVIKELPGLYVGSVSAWVDDPRGPGALMTRLEFDGLSPQGVGKATAWIESQVAVVPDAKITVKK